MNPKRKKKLIIAVLWVCAVIAIVETDNFLKRRAEPCIDGQCTLPAEMAEAIVGPQSVPLHLSSNTSSLDSISTTNLQKKDPSQ